MKTVGRFLHRNIIYPTVVGLRGEGAVFGFLRELETLQWRSADELERRQSIALAETLRNASEHVPFYRRTWGRTVDLPADAAREALVTLPFLTKPELQESAYELVSERRPPRVTRKTTGGSTGQAVTLLKDRDATAREMAASWLGYGWFGVQIGDRAVRFWGQPFTRRRRLRFAAADFAMHRIRFSAFAFDTADLRNYWQRCLRFRPDYLYGYVSMLDAFASHLTEAGIDGKQLGLKLIVTTAEVLSDPQRARLQRTFGCPVQNEYGCGEVGPIAYECPRGALHLMSDHLLVELLAKGDRPAGPGESGEIVVTDLANRAMPLVRYRLGDFAVAGTAPCLCGRGFPTLQRIWGREYDFVETGDGRRFHGEFFMYLFEELRQLGRGIPQFQVVQEGPADLAIAVLSPTEPSVEQLAHLRDRIARHMGPMRIAVTRVDRLERARSGKMRVIVNRWRTPSAPVAVPP
jgi:phenylacetate-CoA ligase